ncbi:uncharacterized protein LOC131683854 [Topomyia yanbarensis]|uniref:uncharacterized protein LOC131683854 n=1 Tax=Topomyia yanbarensis TaxID=2498891 RepID=UPI00273BBAAF|nr:uncharacterized protein LOC131683854 [Topomyia yanbarensis]
MLYSSDMDVYMTVKHLQALSFLPHSRIARAFECIATYIPAKLAGFLEYFKVTYITVRNNNKRPMFHPALWSNHNVVMGRLPLTTNALEAWHRRWTEIVGCSHLSITKIISELRSEQHEIEGRILRIFQENVPQGSQNSCDKIRDICLKCENITDENFVKNVALLLSSKQKRV